MNMLQKRLNGQYVVSMLLLTRGLIFTSPILRSNPGTFKMVRKSNVFKNCWKCSWTWCVDIAEPKENIWFLVWRLHMSRIHNNICFFGLLFLYAEPLIDVFWIPVVDWNFYVILSRFMMWPLSHRMKKRRWISSFPWLCCYSVHLTHFGLILLVLTANYETLALVGPYEFDQGKTWNVYERGHSVSDWIGLIVFYETVPKLSVGS